MVRGSDGIRRLAVLALSCALLSALCVGSAQGASRVVHYHGYSVAIPRSWPIYDLSRDPRQCVRFDRHALYLGSPGAQERCPAHAVGRTEAILIAPIPARRARTRTALSPGAATRAVGLDGFGTDFAVRSAGVMVTATWAQAPGVVARALHKRSLPVSPSSPARPLARPRAAAPGQAHAAGAVFTGLGFDACSAPSAGQMSAWGASPYRALGVYIGGANAACAQPNLSSAWVSSEVAAGWHLIPTYVGLQAPSNDCGCAPINPADASAEGSTAANDAASSAAALGIPAGNPIYDDMEGYTTGGTNTSAVLAYLSAWTSQLHADGYAAGVYSSAGSGMTDLVNMQGTGYVEPDDIWIAEWNGAKSTNSGYVPAGDWAAHQRLHQYRGAHDEKYGGVTINIDNNYLDGATADTSSGAAGAGNEPPPPEPTTPPVLALSPASNGSTYVYASWSGATGVSAWRVLAAMSFSASTLAPVGRAPASGPVTRIAIRNAAPYFAIQALGSGGQVLGTSPAVATPAHIALYGPTAFVPPVSGFGAVPAGCYTGHDCRIALTVSRGGSVIARTGSEVIGAGDTGLLYFKLTPRGRAMLLRAPGRRLPVKVSARDISGSTAATPVTMIPFSASGRSVARAITQSPTVRIVGSVDFVSSAGVGGILAGCRNTTVCAITTTLSVGKVVIAHTGREYLGANELGYLIFSLTPQGRALLRHAAGNQLGAQLTITDNASSTATATATASPTASGRVVLIGFS